MGVVKLTGVWLFVDFNPSLREAEKLLLEHDKWATNRLLLYLIKCRGLSKRIITDKFRSTALPCAKSRQP